jgi:hypothetical protein
MHCDPGNQLCYIKRGLTREVKAGSKNSVELSHSCSARTKTEEMKDKGREEREGGLLYLCKVS